MKLQCGGLGSGFKTWQHVHRAFWSGRCLAVANSCSHTFRQTHTKLDRGWRWSLEILASADRSVTRNGMRCSRAQRPKTCFNLALCAGFTKVGHRRGHGTRWRPEDCVDPVRRVDAARCSGSSSSGDRRRRNCACAGKPGRALITVSFLKEKLPWHQLCQMFFSYSNFHLFY